MQEDGQSAEYAVLAAAMLRERIEAVRQLIVKAGLIPVSLVPHGIATANLAESSIDPLTNEKALGFLRVGGKNSMLVIYVGEKLALARQFKTGFNALLENVIKEYGLDEETAAKFVSSGSFDFTSYLSAGAKSWMHQVGISLDFIERRYGHRVEDLFVLSTEETGPALMSAFRAVPERNVQVWNALDGLGLRDESAGNGGGNEFAIAACEARRIMQKGIEGNA